MRLRALWSVANDLRPFYDEKAKERMHAGENQHTKSPEEKIPQANRAAQSRDEAGKVAGINGRYVDMASDVHLVDQALQLVMRTNKRRNLSSAQWATIGVEAEEVMSAIAEEAKARQVRKPSDSVGQIIVPQASGKTEDKTATKAAEIFGTNRTYINQAAKIQKASLEVFAKVKIQKGLRA